ncbi:hypothetical protein X798_07528 [Onchocerca flexuosa]|uniref:Ovule protein n=2 Tax=Onchocerca flexuosa TaxID=387005 RepID=A0A183HVT3_9BILA|nr:hypothetical protein X798_07528 [Onchocerca flexuosa]VDO77713.1 unnamed protein product [Onchocerca flexuosa]
MPYTTDSSNFEYVPQFLTTTMQFSSSVLPNRAWWMNFPPTPTPSLLNSPSTPSVVHSPSSSSTATVSSVTVNSPTAISSLPSVETHQINSSSKDSLKIFPTSNDTLKLQTERWNIPGPSCLSSPGIATDSTEHGVWKQLSPAAASLNSLLIPQPIYPQENNQIMSKIIPTSSHERSFLLSAGTASVKQEHEKDERIHRFPKYAKILYRY